MRVVVVGGGIIGLSVAWRLLQRDVDVVVFDSGDAGAWQVAAGMLAPANEAAFEYPVLGRLMAESAQRWPDFVTSLGADVGYDETGTLRLAFTADDLAQAERVWSRQDLTRLRPSELREREPALSPRIRAGGYAPTEHQVDPRRVVAALRDRLGPRVVSRRVSTLDGIDADQVIVAAGCATAQLTGLPIRPVKGQVLRLRGAPGLLRHVLSADVDGRHVYVVPRADGEIIVGATQEELSDRVITAGGVYWLLRAAIELVPDLAELRLVETLVGHRPGTADNAPLLGHLHDNVIVAAGHHRNGVLLAPVTADLIADLVTGRPDPMLADFAPGRFR